MKKTVSLMVLLILFGALVLIPSSSADSTTHNKTEYDPQGDVGQAKSGEKPTYVTGRQDVDVVRLKSEFVETPSPLDDDVDLSMTVLGSIQNTNAQYRYVFLIVTNTGDYAISYQAGTGLVVDIESGQTLPIKDDSVSGDTLTVTVTLNSLGSPSSFEKISGIAIQTVSDTERYGDIAPDKLLLITAPSHLSTLRGDPNFKIQGEIRESGDGIPDGTTVSVEIKQGSTVIPGTATVVGNEWEYPWDTSGVTNGEYKIKASISDSGEGVTFEDEITVTVDQNTAGYRSFSQKPSPYIGDYLEYEAVGDASVSGATIAAPIDTMIVEVQAFEQKTVDSSLYNSYRTYIESSGSISIGTIIDYNYEAERTTWRENENFAIVEENTVATTEGTAMDETTVDATTTYDPPLETHNYFQVTVGWHNKWTTTNDAHYTSTTTQEGQTTQNPPSDETIKVAGECLYFQSGLSVLEDTYDVYVIKNNQEGQAFYAIEYYSKELGAPVRIDTYDSNRNLILSLELSEYTPGEPIDAVEILSDITFSPAEPKAKEKVEISFSLKNNGNSEVQDVEVKITDITNGNEAEVGRTTISSIGAGATEEGTISWKPSSEGQHTIKVSIVGTDEEKTVDVEVAPAGDTPLVDMWLIIIIAVIVIVIILALVVIKRRGAKEEAEEGAVDEQAEETEVESAPVTVAEEEAAEGEAAEEALMEETLACPACGKEFTVRFPSKPVKVKCPECGTEGVLK